VTHLSVEQELECLAQGFKDIADHIKDTFWEDRRKTSDLKRVETYRHAAEMTESVLHRLKRNGEILEKPDNPNAITAMVGDGWMMTLQKSDLKTPDDKEAYAEQAKLIVEAFSAAGRVLSGFKSVKEPK
jgi:hypothetical protein